MNKAFLFDMDGVMVDSEKSWTREESNLLTGIFGAEITAKIGSPTGLSIDTIYNRAVENGASIGREKYDKIYHEKAIAIYEKAGIAAGLDELIEKLKKWGYKIGLVSSSPLPWVNQVLNRLKDREKFDLVLSLNKREDIKHKPHPDAYLEAMKVLGSTPKTTLILEDSNPGIASAKASGAFTIGYKPYLNNGYEQKGADVYVSSMKEVEKIAEEF